MFANQNWVEVVTSIGSGDGGIGLERDVTGM